MSVQEHWKDVENLLRGAAAFPIVRIVGAKAEADIKKGREVHRYLERNELGLAWDTLFDVASDQERKPPTAFWDIMILAAEKMKLGPAKIQNARAMREHVEWTTPLIAEDELHEIKNFLHNVHHTHHLEYEEKFDRVVAELQRLGKIEKEWLKPDVCSVCEKESGPPVCNNCR